MKKITLVAALLLVIPVINAQTKEGSGKRLNIPEFWLKQDSSENESARRNNNQDTLFKNFPNIRLPGIIRDKRPVNRFYTQKFELAESRFIIRPDTSVKCHLIIRKPQEMGSYK